MNPNDMPFNTKLNQIDGYYQDTQQYGRTVMFDKKQVSIMEFCQNKNWTSNFNLRIYWE